MTAPIALVKIRSSDIEGAVYEAIRGAGGLEVLIKPDSRVLVKPNLCQPYPSGLGMVTDARVTRAVVKYVLDCGARSVVIGEGSGAGYDFSGANSTEESFRVSGTEDVARSLKVSLRNLNSDTAVEVPVEQGYVMDTVKIAKTAYESDLIISVPVFKTHKRTVVTLSLKNMKGVMPGAEKRKTHSLGLDLGIADLLSVVCPRYVVADGTVGLGGSWNYPEDAVYPGLILAGSDAVAADTVGTHVMGFQTKRVMHLQYLANRQGRTVSLADVPVLGEPTHGWPRFPDPFETFKERFPGVTIVEGEATCSGCSGEMIGALSYVRLAGLAEKLKGLRILMGCPSGMKSEMAEQQEKVLYVGKCCREEGRAVAEEADQQASPTAKGSTGQAEKALYVGGCPPKDETLIRALAELGGFDARTVISLRDSERKRLWESTARLLSS